MWRIIVRSGGQVRQVVSLESEIRAGRGAENDLVLEDQKVSRCHCRIWVEEAAVWVEDMKSANGTWVNAQKIKRVRLSLTDQLSVGPFEIEVHESAGRAPERTPAAVTQPGSPGDELTQQSVSLLLSVLESMDAQAGRDVVLKQLSDALMRMLGGERVFLFAYDARRAKARPVFSHQSPGADPDLPTSITLVVKVARDREPYMVTGLISAEGEGVPSVARLSRGNVQSVVVAPVATPRRLVGVLYIDSRAMRRTFTTLDLDLLGRACTYLAGVLDSVEFGEQLAQENQRLRTLAGPRGRPEVPLETLLAPGSPMAAAVALLKKAAPLDVNVLLTGETGTGKEEAARLVHRSSPRKSGPFVAVNCGAIPENLIEAELFGHAKGAYSGAVEDRPGLVELAANGTLFLDEVGELPQAAQVKLLRVLSERQVTRVGSGVPIDVDFRIIAATHRDLRARLAGGEFREDLFYRLNVFSVTLPPLRERKMDLPKIVPYVIETLAARSGLVARPAAADLYPALERHPWPGNIRELRNALERALIVEEAQQLTPASLALEPPAASSARGGIRPYSDELIDFERTYFARLRAEARNNYSKMARLSRLSRPTVYRKVGELGLSMESSDEES